MRCARLSAEVKAMSKVSPCALSLRPASRASAMPCSVRSTSRQPVNRFFRFHSLWPCRTSTRRRSVSIHLEIFPAQARPPSNKARAFALRAHKRRLQRAAREDHAILGLVRQFDPLGRARRKSRCARRPRCRRATRQSRYRPPCARRYGLRGSSPTLVELDPAALRGRAAKQQRGAGRRIDLLVVMHLEDFDVELFVERLRHPLASAPRAD